MSILDRRIREVGPGQSFVNVLGVKRHRMKLAIDRADTGGVESLLSGRHPLPTWP